MSVVLVEIGCHMHSLHVQYKAAVEEFGCHDTAANILEVSESRKCMGTIHMENLSV